MEFAIPLVFEFAILIFSIVIHEVSHGYAALFLGDTTAKDAGRLTLNPISHLDPIGSIVVPLLTFIAGGRIFGWARPVPFNPYYLRNRRWGPAIVGAVGPFTNFFIAAFFGLVGALLPILPEVKNQLFQFFIQHSFSLIPPGPLGALSTFYIMTLYIVWINTILAVFNIIPIPPLDGSKVLFSLLPESFGELQHVFEQYGFVILLFFIFFFSQFLGLPIFYFFRLLTGSFI